MPVSEVPSGAAARGDAGAGTVRWSRSSWVAETRQLLHDEWTEENEMAVGELDVAPRSLLVRLGRAVCFLQAAEFRTGLYGRSIAVFESSKGRLVNANCLSVGDIVRVVPNGGRNSSSGSGGSEDSPPSGLVSKLTETSVEVAFDSRSEEALRELSEVVRLEKLPNDATHREQLRALDEMEHVAPGHWAQRVSEVLFGETEPLAHALPPKPLVLLNGGLNAPQREAVEFALRSRDVAVIHGPPGTGKTTAVVELIRQAAQVMGLRVLVCAPSNVAVDGIVMRLAEPLPKAAVGKRELRPINMVRMGHPARLTPQVLSHSLDACVARAEGSGLVGDVRSELDQAVALLTGKSKAKKGERPNWRELRAEASALRKELRTREQAVVLDVLKGCNVVLATNAGAKGVAKVLAGGGNGRAVPPEAAFDLVVIDEAAQAIEASCWIPILLGKRVVLAGDHKQLPPTIKSAKAAAGVVGTTLVDRVVALYGDKVTRLLSIQYRMHQLISDWASREMYEGRLLADASVASRRMLQIESVRAAAEAAGLAEVDSPVLQTLVLIDTAGCGLDEAEEGAEEDEPPVAQQQQQQQQQQRKDRDSTEQQSGSKFNRGEAEIVGKHVTELVAAGVDQDEIAVITPYNAQVHLLRAMLLERFPKIEVRSVDGFQGREKEAVVLSLVRSNPKGNVGFLGDDRRLNVAVTRAKRHVCVVCDSETLAASRPGSFLARMVDYFAEHAMLLSADMYLEGVVFSGVHGRSGKAKPPPKGPALSEQRKAELQAQVEAFLKSGQEQLDFAPSLNASERHCVHEHCESLGLQHASTGDGAARFVRISRPLSREERAREAALKAEEARRQREAKEKRAAEHRAASAKRAADRAAAEAEANAKAEAQAEAETRALEAERATGATSSDGEREKGREQEEQEEDETENEASDRDDDGAQAKAPTPRVMSEEAKSFAKSFLPKRYTELMARGLSANDALAAAVADTEHAYRDLQLGNASVPSASPPPSPLPPSQQTTPSQSHPKTELEKLREVQAERYAAKRAAEQAAAAKPTESAKSKQPKVTPSKAKAAKPALASALRGDAVDELDDDAFLDAVVAANKACALAACGKSVQTQGLLCAHCKLRFCYTHAVYEAHGCEHYARVEGRASAAAAATHSDAPKTLKGHQRAHVVRQLGKKIAAEEKKRKPEPPKDKTT
jgi:ATP-dependent RNA/DNA helicase IGHMBP2